MQVIALSRTLPICSRQSLTAVCGSPRSSRPRLAPLVASRTYHVSRVSCAAKDDQDSHAQPNLTAADHPLSIENLRNLAEDVPHTFFSRSTSPYFNLAIEHHLLTYSHPLSRILFTYVNTPCVIIGRNQNPWVECDIRAITRGTADGRHVELIRRRSGGGTVFHDEGNLNYTIIVPAEGFERKTHVQMVVDALVILREKEYMSRRWQDVKVNERNDIVARLRLKYRQEGVEEDWFKVSGTAFKLTRGRALHHGTLLHSSPYVDSIGSFLRSPGKDYITAKGVESVRSPVTNLWHAPKARQRRLLSYNVRRAIEHMWQGKYAVESSNSPDSIPVAHGQPEDLIPELMAGIHELQTHAWRWNQTPSFSFDSKEIVIGGKSLQLGFDAKNGLIQSVKASGELQATYGQLLVGQSIQGLSALNQWQEILTDGEMTTVLQKVVIQLLETCFPPLENKYYGNMLQQKTEAGSIETQGQSSHALSDNKQEIRYGGRLHPNEVGMLHKLDNAIEQLGIYLIKWSILWQRVSNVGNSIPRAGNMIRKMGRVWLHLVLDDLIALTEQVNTSMMEVQRTMVKLLNRSRNRARRQAKFAFQPMHARLAQIASKIKAQTLQLTRILTRVLVEERERASRRSVRVGLYDDDERIGTNEQKDSQCTPEISAEARSNAQSILEATLAMIDQQDQQGER
jgi:lipoate-protein ligase A